MTSVGGRLCEDDMALQIHLAGLRTLLPSEIHFMLMTFLQIESAMASLMFFDSVRLTDFQLLVLTDDLLSNDVQKDVVDRMYACLTNQHNETMSPLVLVPVC
ncbi:hypothetical protein Tco_0911687 [Tanacetum coccineum]|uniref:Uncharacterized protein n=1 Tax=Tanacetum coccineum TaxID=301880 RepID=A0ABQ5CZ64_9ASTR